MFKELKQHGCTGMYLRCVAYLWVKSFTLTH
jgi:hypothetical protein